MHDKDDQPKALSITKRAFFLSRAQTLDFIEIDFSGDHKNTNIEYFTKGVTRVYSFKGMMIGQTEDSLYLLREQNLGDYSREALLFTTHGYIQQVFVTLGSILISYADTPKKTKIIVLEDKFQIKDPKDL